MKRKVLISVLVAGILITIVGLSSCGTEKKTAQAKPLIGEFETVQLNGKPATNEIFKESKLTMINVWATFCTPCINEMPDLGEINREYKKKDFQIVGIVSDIVDAKESKAVKIVSETKADYTHLIVDKNIASNFMKDIQVVPTTYFVDSEGMQVGDVYTGSKSKEDWIKIIKEMQELVNENK